MGLCPLAAVLHDLRFVMFVACSVVSPKLSALKKLNHTPDHERAFKDLRSKKRLDTGRDEITDRDH